MRRKKGNKAKMSLGTEPPQIVLFDCIKPTKLRLTKQTCANMYYQANRTNKNGVSGINPQINAFHYCSGCSEGKKNHQALREKGKGQIKVPKKKQCALYRIDPTQCMNEKVEGWFYRLRTQKDQNWGAKKYCCGACGTRYNYMKAKGKIK